MRSILLVLVLGLLVGCGKSVDKTGPNPTPPPVGSPGIDDGTPLPLPQFSKFITFNHDHVYKSYSFAQLKNSITSSGVSEILVKVPFSFVYNFSDNGYTTPFEIVVFRGGTKITLCSYSKQNPVDNGSSVYQYSPNSCNYWSGFVMMDGDQLSVEGYKSATSVQMEFTGEVR